MACPCRTQSSAAARMQPILSVHPNIQATCVPASYGLAGGTHLIPSPPPSDARCVPAPGRRVSAARLSTGLARAAHQPARYRPRLPARTLAPPGARRSAAAASRPGAMTGSDVEKGGHRDLKSEHLEASPDSHDGAAQGHHDEHGGHESGGPNWKGDVVQCCGAHPARNGQRRAALGRVFERAAPGASRACRMPLHARASQQHRPRSLAQAAMQARWARIAAHSRAVPLRPSGALASLPAHALSAPPAAPRRRGRECVGRLQAVLQSNGTRASPCTRAAARHVALCPRAHARPARAPASAAPACTTGRT